MVKVVMPAGKGGQKRDFCTPSQAGRVAGRAGRPWAQCGTENGLPLCASQGGWQSPAACVQRGLPACLGLLRETRASVITAVPLCELPGTRACTAPADRRALPESLGQDLTALGGPAPCPPAWCLLRQHPEEEGSSTRHPGERARPGVSLGLATMPALVVPGSRSQSRASSMGASPTCVSRRLCLCESVCARVCTCMYMCLCVPKCACVYLSVCVSVCMCVCVSVCFVGVG